MVGGEWGEPVDGEVVGPHEEDGDVDWEDPDHEDEDRVRVVVEIIVGPRALYTVRSMFDLGGTIRRAYSFADQPQCSRACR